MNVRISDEIWWIFAEKESDSEDSESDSDDWHFLDSELAETKLVSRGHYTYTYINSVLMILLIF